jgi:hypothetical protein
MKTEPRALFSSSGHRAMKVQAWVVKWAEAQGLTLRVQVEQTLRQDVHAQEGVTKNTMTIRVVCGNGLEYLNLKDIHASFIQRNGLKGTCVYGREDINFNKKKGNDRPRVFTAIVDKQVLSRLLTIQKRAQDTLRYKAQLNSIAYVTKVAAFCYKAGIGRVAIHYTINKARHVMLSDG